MTLHNTSSQISPAADQVRWDGYMKECKRSTRIGSLTDGNLVQLHVDISITTAPRVQLDWRIALVFAARPSGGTRKTSPLPPWE